jgi:branched-chain amino acid transport system substrate-binding protein
VGRLAARGAGTMALTALAMVVAACGSNAGGGPAAGGSASAGGSGSTAPGSALKIMQILPEDPAAGAFFPAAKAALKGRIDRLNKQGGIHGATVQLDVCTGGLDPNKTDDCARKAASGGYLAVVGSFTAGGDWESILEKAHTPNIGVLPTTLADGTTSIAFPLTGGGYSDSAGCAAALYDVLGAKNIVLAYDQVPASASTVDSSDLALKARGTKLKLSFGIPTTETDVSADVQRLVSGGDGYTFSLVGATFPKMLSGTVARVGTKKVCAYEDALRPEVLSAVGASTLNGLTTVSTLATDDLATPGVKSYLADQASADKSLPSSSTGKLAWAAGDLFAVAAAKATSETPEGLLAALNATSGYDAGGLLPQIDFTKPGTAIAGQPRIVNADVLYSHLQDSKFVSTRPDFVDPFKKP